MILDDPYLSYYIPPKFINVYSAVGSTEDISSDTTTYDSSTPTTTSSSARSNSSHGDASTGRSVDHGAAKKAMQGVPYDHLFYCHHPFLN